MPYENEHSARLKNPKDFEPKSFRRTNGGTIYGTKKVPKTIAIIWAKLKGKSKPKDPVIPQALRFPTKSWTVQKAKKWLKDNNVEFQSFEPAKKKEKQSTSNDTAPISAFIFNDNAEVSFAQGDGEKKDDHFRIVGYSGGIMKNHWLWGDVGLDLEGMKFAKNRTPVLEEHFKQSRIGFTTKQDITDKVTVEGPFLDNDNAQNLKTDMQKGFPMEASLLVLASIVEHIKDGETTKVNGQILKGPGTVFRKSTIREVSMCVFGLDRKAKSSAYADMNNQEVKFNLQENTIMAGEETQTVTEIESVESFAALYPVLFEEILTGGKVEGLAEGKKQERALFAALKDACGDDHELLVKCFDESKTATEAMKLHVEKLGKEKTQLTEQVTELQKAKPAVEAARVEFSDEATPPGEQTETVSADEAALKAEFAASADLQTEYGGDVEAYVAFKQADARGQVRGELATAK